MRTCKDFLQVARAVALRVEPSGLARCRGFNRYR
jgi:hypothetical protein